MSAPMPEAWTNAQRSAIDEKRTSLVEVLQLLGDSAAIWFRCHHLLTGEQVSIVQSIAVPSSKAYKIIESLEIRPGGWQGILTYLDEQGSNHLTAELESLAKNKAATASASNKVVPLNQPDSASNGPPHTNMEAVKLRAIYKDNRTTLLDFVDGATIARHMGSLEERVRDSLSSDTSPMGREARVEKLLAQIVLSDESVKEFAKVLYLKQPNVYDKLF